LAIPLKVCHTFLRYFKGWFFTGPHNQSLASERDNMPNRECLTDKVIFIPSNDPLAAGQS
jgi:hypothetical protein